MLNERKGSKGHVLHDSIYGVLLKRENFIDEDISICQALGVGDNVYKQNKEVLRVIKVFYVYTTV